MKSHNSYDGRNGEVLDMINRMLGSPVVPGSTILETLLYAQRLGTAQRLISGSLEVIDVKLSLETVEEEQR